MALAAGTKLGPYEILAPIGAGGMGEVYRSRDTRLDRTVAIKISKEKFSERFEREARSIAALNHPHICILHDVGPNYLVMEYIEGAPLKGPYAPAKALLYAAQICEALDHAHRHGITHRDLKPANVLVTKQGVKLLDFGLANTADSYNTLTLPATVIGTPAYMAPELWQGKRGEERSDIYSFGCVLYEMLTGEPVGPTRAPLKDAALEAITGRCLEKDPEDRWQTVRDLKAALALAPVEPDAAPLAKSAMPYVAAAAVFAIIAAVALWAPWRTPVAEQQAVRFQLSPPPGVAFPLSESSAISPDGRTIAVTGVSSEGTKLWIRPLDSTDFRELPFTDGAQYPFWSPDSRSIGFFAEGKLKRVELSGGLPGVLADAPSARGGTWNSAGTILFAPTVAGGLMRVSAAGGTAVPMTELSAANDLLWYRWPEFLPDGRRFLFFGIDHNIASVYLASLDRTRVKATLLVHSLTNAHYSPPYEHRPGYLLWLQGTGLRAQRFDPAGAHLSGDAVFVPNPEIISFINLYPVFSVSTNGTILTQKAQPGQLAWFNREGKMLNVIGRANTYSDVHLSPDGIRAALSISDSLGSRDLWVLDLTRNVQTRLTTGNSGYVGVWSPDGSRVAYHTGNFSGLYVRNANGAGAEEKLTESKLPVFINDWSLDGRYVVYTESNPETQYDLWLLPMSGDRKPFPFLKTRAGEWQGKISPDGKWIAYVSDDSSRQEVYVASFPAGGSKWAVSTTGGNYPRWRRDGKELFYRGLDGRLMAAAVRATGRGLEFGAPAALFRIGASGGAFAYPYDVSADGQQILVLAPSVSDSPPLMLLTNWQATLNK